MIDHREIRKANVTFRLEGEGIDGGFPLVSITTALQEYHHILDRCYGSITGVKKMSLGKRREFTIIAIEFRKGSFEAQLQLYLFLAGQLLPGVIGIGPKDVLEVARNACDFLKTYLHMKDSGATPVVQVHGDNNAPILVVQDSNISIHKTAYEAVEASEAHFKKLSSIIREGGIEKVSSLDDQGKGIVLTEKERSLFNPKTRIDKEVITIRGNIVRYDKMENIGRVEVFPGQAIEPGRYTFRAIDEKSTARFIRSMLEQSVALNVLREMAIHSLGSERVVALRIIEIEGPDTPSLFG